MKSLVKSIVFVLAVCFILAAVTACGDQPEAMEPQESEQPMEMPKVEFDGPQQESSAEIVGDDGSANSQPTPAPTPEPTPVPELPPFEEIEIEGEGTITLSVYDKSVDFSIPTEIEQYNEIKQMDYNMAMMIHDIFSGASGRTMVEMYEATPEEYLSYRQADVSVAQRMNVGDREVLLYTAEEESENAFEKMVVSKDYVFATMLDDKVVLGFCVSFSIEKGKTCDIDDSIVEVLLSHCTIN